MNKEEYVEYILGGTDFYLVQLYILNKWDAGHKSELLHDLLKQLEDKQPTYDCDTDEDDHPCKHMDKKSCGCDL